MQPLCGPLQTHDESRAGDIIGELSYLMISSRFVSRHFYESVVEITHNPGEMITSMIKIKLYFLLFLKIKCMDLFPY